MRSRTAVLLVVAALAASLVQLPAAAAGKARSQAANGRAQQPLIARELAPHLRDVVPVQLPEHETSESPDATSDTQCHAPGDVTHTSAAPGHLVLTLQSWDPDNALSQDVVFVRETVDAGAGKATLWVAWDFLTTAYGREDVITCDMLGYLQGEMDDIVATDVAYFGEYDQRPAGNENIDVMIYNVVDESYFDEEFGSYIAGFFSSGFEEQFDRNMIFIDSYDWPNRIGPNESPWRPDDDGSGNDRPNLYEGTVAHELEHLIHNDHDGDEESWIDEGLADLAQLVNGYGHDQGHIVYYLAFHRTSLTQWGSSLEDYGAAYLFQVYLAEQFGGLTDEFGDYDADSALKAWTRSLVAEPANSILGVETAATAANDDAAVAFKDLFDSWILANYLDDETRDGAGGWPIGYQSIDLRPYVTDSFSPWSIERSIKDIYGAGHHGALPTSRYYGGYVSGSVEYPVGELAPHTPLYSSYKAMQPELDAFVAGAARSGVEPDEGTWEVASGGGHLMTDRWVALGVADESVTFRTWFDIEEDWDFGFVEIADGEGGWVPLEGSITGHSDNPFGSTAWANSPVAGQASTDAAVTGASGGWTTAEFAIPEQYAGGTVRLNYYTDEAVNNTGWFVDEVTVDGAYVTGFEEGDPVLVDSNEDDPWVWTTGLFENDWVGAYVNPIYHRGRLVETEVDYLTSALVDVTGDDIVDYDFVFGAIDTSSLNRDEAMVVVANRPGESPFAAWYQNTPDKGSAGAG